MNTGNIVVYIPHTGVESVEELTYGLLTDDYCHVCDAVLLFKSQRLSHYEVCVACQEFVVNLKHKSYSDCFSLSHPSNSGEKTCSKTQSVSADKENREDEKGGCKRQG